MLKEDEEMAHLIVQHFNALFSALTQNAPTYFLDYQQEGSVRRLTNLSPENSPIRRFMWPYSRRMIFFQKQWHITGSSISDAILKTLNIGVFPHVLNHTHIVLIQKKQIPKKVGDFRPISLCNMMYKLISNVIANRLKQWMHSFISHTQSAFVPRRLITDNVLLAHELMHCLNKKRQGKKGYMSLKLNMSKAYDRISQTFLQKVMVKMGLNQKMVAMIMTCVRTLTFSILINGKTICD